MSVPNLPKATPGSGSVDGPGLRPGPRLLLRGTSVGLALLVLVLLLAACGGGPLPAAPPPSPAPPPTTSSAAPSPTSASPEPEAAPSTTRTAPEAAPPAPPAGRPPGNDGGGGAARDGAPAPAAGPLWPAGDAAAARRMQEQADRGGDPWLLDPEEVAISYVGSELGYRNPKLTWIDTGRFDIAEGRSPARATVVLEQTVRPGDGGVWLVTRVDRH
ncbi:hypothetical protein [Pseudonocardia sp. HH130630-07]|uniref:hypothetical protein n=1 Tax=Pseudonocardia sp. HH130630-07 TaxID=1690815 RepID=UPI00081515C8|nr:hypothetical protein [Pseudonocardia sp. HH130630-07]ANY08575.1 hypothetical protein AFB00_22470 [Pseudonocardia sp. HH130630-07]